MAPLSGSRLVSNRYATDVLHLLRSKSISSMGPRLDTGGWLTLTEIHYCLSSRQGLSPCKIRRAFLGATTPSKRLLSEPDCRGRRERQGGAGLFPHLERQGGPGQCRTARGNRQARLAGGPTQGTCLGRRGLAYPSATSPRRPSRCLIRYRGVHRISGCYNRDATCLCRNTLGASAG